MLSDVKTRTTFAATGRGMSRSLEQKQSSIRQQTPEAVKEKIRPPRADASSRYRDTFGPGFGQPYRGLHGELRQNGSTETVIQFRSSVNHQMTQQGSKTCKDDELVKHMSKLPNFLQQVPKEKSVQEKALNFGVLDWKRLEKWKYNERMPAKSNRKTTSTSNNSLVMTSGPPKISSQLRKQLSSHGLRPNSPSPGKQASSCGSNYDSSPLNKQFPTYGSLLNERMERKMGGIEPSKGKSTYIKDFQSRSSTMGGQKGSFNQEMKSCGRDPSEINMNHDERNYSVKKIVLEKEALALDQGKNGSSVFSPKTINVQEGKSKTRCKDEVLLTSQRCSVEPQNIVLLVPNHFPKMRSSETSQFTESKMLFDGQLPKGNRTRFSDDFSPQEPHSGEFASVIPHSCPLSTSVMVNNNSGMEPPNLVNTVAMASELCPTAVPDNIIAPLKKFEAKRSFSFDASKKMDVDTQQKAGKGRHPSPTRRFSFSLGKMTKSFSFKESSGVPQLTSTYTAPKSGPVGSELSSSMESYNKDKATASSRRRSSPLRRLLDPLLKYKGAHSAEIVPQPDGNSHVMPSKPMNNDGQIQERNHGVSTFQALLQLSVKNGLPFFKFAADNSSNVLAAAIKKLPSSRKGDCCLIYTFYSVHEFKKKGMSWINQEPKGKSHGLGYNVVAQMKISSSYLQQLNSMDSSLCMVRECVLYGVDLVQVDKQTPELFFNSEIAAIVIKNTCEKLKDEGLSDEGRPFEDREFARGVSGEDENPSSTVVILPVGIHGLPTKGAPSPLINRWKSGGSCDCGGWDVGCKLQILANQDRCSKITGPSMHSSVADRLDLLVQGGERGSKPILSLEPKSNGFYSVEFNASISLLEAFSVCVASITSRKLPEILDVNNLSETACLSESTIGKDEMKQQTTPQVPVKYVTCPPASPVGRI